MCAEFGVDPAFTAREGHYARDNSPASEPKIPQVYDLNQQLSGTPVMIVESYDMLSILARWFAARKSDEPRSAKAASPIIAYIMSDEGELPFAVNRPQALPKGLDWLSGVVTYGLAYGGDVETMDRQTALMVAKKVYGAELIIIGKGADVHSSSRHHDGWASRGISLCAWSRTVEKLGGITIAVPAIGAADPENPWASQKAYARMSCHFLEELSRPEAGRCLLALPESVEQAVHQLLQRQLNASGISQTHDIRWMEGLSPYRLAQILAVIPEGTNASRKKFVERSDYYQVVCAAAELACRLLPVQLGAKMEPIE